MHVVLNVATDSLTGVLKDLNEDSDFDVKFSTAYLLIFISVDRIFNKISLTNFEKNEASRPNKGGCKEILLNPFLHVFHKQNPCDHSYLKNVI